MNLIFRLAKPAVLIMLFFQHGDSFGLTLSQYVRGYNLGVNLIGQSEGASIKFDVDTESESIPNSVVNCGTFEAGETTRTCLINMSGASSSGFGASYLKGFGIYLQQPFKRTGNFYFNWDLSLGLQLLNAVWENESEGFEYSGLQNLSYSLYGFQFKPYIQVGWTPKKIPDFIFTLGPVVQVVGGTVSVNQVEHQTIFLSTSSINSSILPWAQSYFELEIVFLRFGEGAFSWYLSRVVTGNEVSAGSFFDKEVGAMSNFVATFNSFESGLKLLMSWP